MKFFGCLAFLISTYFVSEAQYQVVFTLEKYPVSHNPDSIFIAGDFNDWNPRNSEFAFSPLNRNGVEIKRQLPAGNYAYKCTRGIWQHVEADEKGSDINNHRFNISRDTTIKINIEAWKDDFDAVLQKHTASGQVHMMDTAFFMPQLNRTRRIWIYLPEGYSKTKTRYPVLYMHDGQNIFDAATSAYGEWGVDECLDSLVKAGKPTCIVVGIDNGPQRLNEYNPYAFQQFGKGEAKQYLAFLVETLKPFIDNNYRSLPDKDNTIIAGSSMGALVSYYAVLQQPGVFGKAGIFSPAFWTAPAILSLTDSLAPKVNSKFFFYMGKEEGYTYIKEMENVLELLGKKSSSMIYSVVDPLGMHNEKAWRKWFPEFYLWMMASGFNMVIHVNN